MIKKTTRREERRVRRHRARKKISGSPTRPRLSVFRSEKQIYAQLIDDTKSMTLLSASSIENEKPKKKKKASAESGKSKKSVEKTEGDKTLFSAERAVGALIAKRALEKGIKTVVFDRGGFQYHGRVRALADAAREAGLTF